jgi:hypothetical protein
MLREVMVDKEAMSTPGYEGVFVVLLPQRGRALTELLLDAARQFLGERDLRSWSLEYGPLSTPAGAVAFRLSHPNQPFPWREITADLALSLSKLGPGRCWALVMEKPSRGGEGEGWAEGFAYDRGERVGYEEASGPSSSTDLMAWFGEELALSENEVQALFESCEQRISMVAGEAKAEDEIDQILERARQEFQRYRELRDAREREEQSS